MNKPSSSDLASSHFDSKSIEKHIEKMTLQQKIGQLFLTFIWNDTLTEEAKKFLFQTKIGNIIYFSWANALTSVDQVTFLSQKLSTFIQETTGISPLIAVDQEGGFVTRLHGEFTHFPSPMSLAATQDPSLAKKMGAAIGKELLQVGINFNLAPVVDIHSGSARSPINVRSFGSCPKTVTQLAHAMMEGMEESGILYCLKHAPGYGNASKDAHEETPSAKKNFYELEQSDFYPFEKLAKKAPVLMTAHLLYPALDPEKIATFSPKIIQDLIRKKWDYDGIIMSDSLAMNAVLEKKDTLEEAKESMASSAIKAFLAGCDMMILSKLEWTAFLTTSRQDYEIIEYVIASFIRHAESGLISSKRIDDSLRKILHVKSSLPSSTKKQDSFHHKELALEIAQKSLTLLSPSALLSSEKEEDLLLIFPKEFEKQFPSSKKISSFLFSIDCPEDTFSHLSTWVASHYNQGSHLVFFSCHTHLFPKQKELLEKFCEVFSSYTISIVSLSHPYDVMEKERNAKHPTYVTYSADPYSIQNVLTSIEEKNLPIGKLPLG